MLTMEIRQANPSLYDDYIALCESLEETPAEDCHLWIFWMLDGETYSVYVAANSHHVAGCLADRARPGSSHPNA